jgi:NodT family efflux transporter outer membrane factor (OMF) lipoprotein
MSARAPHSLLRIAVGVGLATGAAFSLSACASLDGMMAATRLSGPALSTADAALPTLPARWSGASAVAIEPELDWLTPLGGPTLTALVAEALTANPDMASASAQLRAAEARLRATRGFSGPSADLGISASSTSAGFELGGSTERATSFEAGLSLTASWEPDLWGRLAVGIGASAADLEAANADLAGARLSLAASVAQQWVQLTAARRQLELAELELATRQRALELTERRFSRGLTDALSVRTSRSVVAGGEAQVAAQRQTRDRAARSLEVRLGRYPSGELMVADGLPRLPGLSAASTPAEVLTRRPDIAAAEARLTAAGLRATEARAALLPSLRLSASVSNGADNLADFFDPALILGRIAGNLLAPLYRGGALDAQADAAFAQAEASLAAYVREVLNAWNEVETALAADGFLAAQEEALLRAAAEANEAEQLAERQYREGLATIFELLDAQARRFSTESNLISVQSGRAQNRIAYHLALGGALPPLPPA